MTIPVAGRTLIWSRTAPSPFGSVPARLLHPVLPVRSVLAAADGSLIAYLYQQDRQPVPLSSVAGVARQAVLAAEDVRFYHHGGVDPVGIIRAGITDLLSGTKALQGGSSITQQYVKEVLADTAATPAERQQALADTFGRKLKEARYAIALDRLMSKDQILQGYLNLVYFGEGAYGIEAAAERYFARAAAQLTLPEAALLAGVIRDPTGLDPLVHPEAAEARRDEVLTAMLKANFISGVDLMAALTSPLGLHPVAPVDGCAESSTPFFCAWAYQRLLQTPALGSTPAQREQLLLQGGLTIVTTLDRKVQAAAQAAVYRGVPPGGPFAAAVDAVTPGTGALRAMAVDRPFGPAPGATTLNLADGGSTGYPAGSTFKLFTLTAAMELGIPVGLTMPAPPTYVATGFRNCQTGVPFPPYPVRNAEAAEGGVFDLPHATWESVNTYYVQLEQRTGQCLPARIAGQLGVTLVDGRPLDPVPSLTLGSEAVSPLAMSGAYAAMAAHGLYCPPFAITSIRSADGTLLPPVSHPCRQAVPPAVAATVTGVLRGVIDGPDPNRTGAAATIGRPAAGKTGTTEDFSAAWFCGYTPTLGGCVWVGDPAGGFAHPLINVTIAGRFYDRVFGASIPAPIWAMTMSRALAGVAPAPLP